MNVVSLVPSWTETLINCQINVVGRTRFCIHPKDAVQRIPVVGGTKDLDWSKITCLNADLLILDKEENLPWMKEQCPLPVFTSHIESVQSVSDEMLKLSKVLSSSQLLKRSEDWRNLAKINRHWDWANIPGCKKIIRKDFNHYERLVYVIWQKPFMSISKDTFIGSVLSTLGADSYLPDFGQKYPEFKMEDFDLKKTFFLFSSEPFPFHKREAELLQLKVQGVIVDGESYSWFGDRSYRFLSGH